METAAGDDQMEEPLLTCRNVSKHFGALAAVNNLSVKVKAGEVLGIGGPNGAGKTTLFEAISGLNPASSGEIIFQGRDITRLPPDAVCHAGIARTYQLNAGFDSMSVRDNVRVAAYFGRRNRRIPGFRFGSDSDAQVREALELVGLADKGDELTGRLPVVDRKLLMLAGALASNPKLLLMDEPVGGLNPKEIDLVMEVTRRIVGRGITIILIEHVMRFLVQLSDRVLIMHHGEKIYEGSPQGLVHDRNVVDVYLGEGASQRLGALMQQVSA
ncbi:amino acid/amide ABC transporter ATP-binding protein 1 (HAAT family) [Dongia mobilis]|uniref:Amino acid/amide ABC transporter ATP-binding protein 1 (HAAT family) n=1 Tax=Dongia mobilis TaxID=578943 RepID=A0A4R6WV13_9PROT|nr:ABC transporter ATP-binding protein [Dongia mobilis]TDQ83854.1 amino acid/amide ABC transporter ATP-binding protein 1 (HAAT family) [Dongia mobilis]